MAIAVGGLLLASTAAAAEADGDVFGEQAVKIERVLRQAREGGSVSQTRLGWLIADLLADLSARDPALSAFFHRDGRFIETYLINVFQHQAAHEVAAVEAMAAEGRRNLRLAARSALEALRHIPDDADPPANQEQDRREMIEALTELDGLLRNLAAAPDADN